MKLALVAVIAGGCFIEPPRPPLVVETARPIAAGDQHACAARDDGTLFCWGDDAHGQLGSKDVPYTGMPLQLSMTGWTVVAGGTAHTCAVRDGQVWCWGDNTHSQCGTSDFSDVEPQQVLVPHVQTVFAGGDATCGADGNGELWCWGDADVTRDGFQTPTTFAPANIASGWRSIGFADTHACALTSLGDIYCWGHNNMGELGTADTRDVGYNAAVPASGGPYIALAVGHDLTCAIDKPGDLYCWGRGMPITAISTTHDWTSVAVGSSEACGVRAGGALYCYGADESGVNGTYAAVDKIDTSNPPIAADAGEIALGVGFGCTRATDGRFACWGANRYGELGNGEIASEHAPAFVDNVTADAIAVGDAFTCIIAHTTHTITCWGDNRMGQIRPGGDPFYTQPTAILDTKQFTLLSAGSNHLCGVHSIPGGTDLLCFGSLAEQQSRAPGWARIASGGNVVCGVDTTNVGLCWGAIPDFTGQPPYVYMNANLLLPEKLYVTRYDQSANTVTAWGKQCSFATEVDASAPEPVATLGTGGDIALATSADGHACAIWQVNANTRKLSCWGTNDVHQSSPSFMNCDKAPVEIPAPAGEAWPDPTLGGQQVATAASHTCALTTSGKAYCWGDNTDFSLATLGNPITPTLLDSPTAWRDLVTAGHHTCGIDTQSRVACWGRNVLGEVGNGRRFHAELVDVVLP